MIHDNDNRPPTPVMPRVVRVRLDLPPLPRPPPDHTAWGGLGCGCVCRDVCGRVVFGGVSTS